MTSVFEDWVHSHMAILAKCEDSYKFQPNALAGFYPHENPPLAQIAQRAKKGSINRLRTEVNEGRLAYAKKWDAPQQYGQK